MSSIYGIKSGEVISDRLCVSEMCMWDVSDMIMFNWETQIKRNIAI